MGFLSLWFWSIGSSAHRGLDGHADLARWVHIALGFESLVVGHLAGVMVTRV